MLFILKCMDRDGGAELRVRARLPHLEFVASRAQAFRFGGPLLGEDGVVAGSLMILDLPDEAALDAHMRSDPFFTAGLFRSVEVWHSRQVVPETVAGALAAEVDRQRLRAAELEA
ncbi:MAG: hypothetical protein KDH15_17425 [Rhodocyclaceae bacterium]|nr:hypothetical protein [Rhodocyclaceae bacterium]